jgi:hypothetical protein
MLNDQKRTRVFCGARVVAILSAGAAFLAEPGSAIATISVEFRPAHQVVMVGETVEIGVYLVADPPVPVQTAAAAQVIFTWDPALLHFLGNDNAGGYPLLASGFPTDPYGLNESHPPQDGDGIYIAFANFGDPIPATVAGTLLTTLQFTALAPTVLTPITIQPTGGHPQGRTEVFDATIPNTDVTGSLRSADVTILMPGPGGATLSLVRSNATGPIHPGDTVMVEVRMSDLGTSFAAGFQAYLAFDPSRLTFTSGEYTPAPFGHPIITPIVASGNDIDLASEISVPDGQLPTNQDSVLATLTFTAVQLTCTPAVSFRPHDPPTRITDVMGNPFEPLVLVDPLPACPCDWNCDGVLNSQDYFDFLNGFFANDADFNMNGVTDSQDFFDFINCFFAALPGCSS